MLAKCSSWSILQKLNTSAVSVMNGGWLKSKFLLHKHAIAPYGAAIVGFPSHCCPWWLAKKRTAMPFHHGGLGAAKHPPFSGNISSISQHFLASCDSWPSPTSAASALHRLWSSLRILRPFNANLLLFPAKCDLCCLALFCSYVLF